MNMRPGVLWENFLMRGTKQRRISILDTLNNHIGREPQETVPISCPSKQASTCSCFFFWVVFQGANVAAGLGFGQVGPPDPLGQKVLSSPEKVVCDGLGFFGFGLSNPRAGLTDLPNPRVGFELLSETQTLRPSLKEQQGLGFLRDTCYKQSLLRLYNCIMDFSSV